MQVNWSKTAYRQFTEILDFIVENGYDRYAETLQETVIEKTDNLTENYLSYPADKYKKHNDGSYRAFEIDEYRISYRVTEQSIRIIRIRHTSRRVLNY